MQSSYNCARPPLEIFCASEHPFILGDTNNAASSVLFWNVSQLFHAMGEGTGSASVAPVTGKVLAQQRPCNVFFLWSATGMAKQNKVQGQAERWAWANVCLTYILHMNKIIREATIAKSTSNPQSLLVDFTIGSRKAALRSCSWIASKL